MVWTSCHNLTEINRNPSSSSEFSNSKKVTQPTLGPSLPHFETNNTKADPFSNMQTLCQGRKHYQHLNDHYVTCRGEQEIFSRMLQHRFPWLSREYHTMLKICRQNFAVWLLLSSLSLAIIVSNHIPWKDFSLPVDKYGTVTATGNYSFTQVPHS